MNVCPNYRFKIALLMASGDYTNSLVKWVGLLLLLKDSLVELFSLYTSIVDLVFLVFSACSQSAQDLTAWQNTILVEFTQFYRLHFLFLKLNLFLLLVIYFHSWLEKASIMVFDEPRWKSQSSLRNQFNQNMKCTVVLLTFLMWRFRSEYPRWHLYQSSIRKIVT